MTTETLEKLPDDEIRLVIGRGKEILSERDRQRKEVAKDEARAILLRAGLTPDDLSGKAKSRGQGSGKGPAYHAGRHYQHPTKKALVWNAKGQKPNWLRQLEAAGGKALESGSAELGSNAAPKEERKGSNETATKV